MKEILNLCVRTLSLGLKIDTFETFSLSANFYSFKQMPFLKHQHSFFDNPAVSAISDGGWYFPLLGMMILSCMVLLGAGCAQLCGEKDNNTDKNNKSANGSKTSHSHLIKKAQSSQINSVGAGGIGVTAKLLGTSPPANGRHS